MVRPGGRLGIYGFGGSAHLTAQVALHLGMRVHVLTRGANNQDSRDAWESTRWATPTARHPSHSTARSSFAPAGTLVPTALRALDRGGTSPWPIWLSEIPAIDYDAELFQERNLCSVTANTRADGEALLRLADRFGIHAETTTYQMGEAPRALADLAHGRFSGAAVLCAWTPWTVSPTPWAWRSSTMSGLRMMVFPSAMDAFVHRSVGVRRPNRGAAGSTGIRTR